jgi:hypothetical protein
LRSTVRGRRATAPKVRLALARHIVNPRQHRDRNSGRMRSGPSNPSRHHGHVGAGPVRPGTHRPRRPIVNPRQSLLADVGAGPVRPGTHRSRRPVVNPCHRSSQM